MKKRKTESHKTWRLMNRDGSFNIERVDAPRGSKRKDLYHQLMTLSWSGFLGFLICVYFGMNLAFGCIYFLLGPHALIHSAVDLATTTPLERFGNCFFFSVETFATIGYGNIIPFGLLANTIVTIEAFLGLLCVALLTGLIFQRFSRPTAKVVFSNKALIQPIDGVPSLTIRFANLRTNQIAEAQVTVSYARNETTKEGTFFREFDTLKLETSHSSMFVLSWTLVHRIDSSSPLFGLTAKDLERNETEIFVVMTGWDETYGQTVHSRYSYGPDEILWNHRFKDIIRRTPDRQRLVLDIRNMHDVETV